MKENKSKIDNFKIAFDSSLGHLAYGDLAFKSWRKIKTENNLKMKNEEE